MPKVEISQIQLLVSEGKIMWTEHIAIRLRERAIKRNDLIECIKSGEIIEQYPYDMPFFSCLMLCICKAGKPFHIVVGIKVDVLCYMITAYRPDLDKWEADFKTRKEGN